ncbi:2'-5' RNA ligase family protein [Marivibrio halodurans]|uniref:2'-5' RNA ligase family protein n=1 Tax=Marivibrio halodurans TaxID=2039722 RepID=A0A8J7V4E9_9PROT|nr:2'-5' RNA ligase family protein [Marivibrio halodurans]MBP5857629.1 2'-5' RNA ligase family protein [Marivibrio halodurans]
MPLAVTIRLDRALSADIESFWRDLGPTDKDMVPRLPYPPHLTLAILDDAMPAEEATRVLSGLSGTFPRTPIKISHVGVFPGKPAYIFLAPVVTEDLLTLHDTLVRVFPTDTVHMHHRVGNWVPHITVGAALRNIGGIMDRAHDMTTTLHGRTAEAELVQFPPVHVIATVHPSTR